MLMNMLLELCVEILESALQGLHGPGCERAKRVPWSVESGLKLQLLEISRLSSAFFHSSQDSFCPVETAPAGSAPTTGLLREEMLQVPDHADRTCVIIQHNHGSCAQPAARFLYFVEIHAHVQMLLGKKVGRSAAGKQAAKLHTVAHPSRVFFQDFADGCA